MDLVLVLSGLILLVFWGLINKTVYASVKLMSEPLPLFKLKDCSDDPAFQQQVEDTSRWAEDHHYRFDCLFDFHGSLSGSVVQGAVWKNAADASLLLFYYALGRAQYDLVTIYDEQTGITTCNSKDALTLPFAPGSYVQAFPGLSLSALALQHQSARQRLERKLELQAQPLRETTLTLLVKSLQRQMSYIKSLPFWYFRGSYWYLVRRNILCNKAISA